MHHRFCLISALFACLCLYACDSDSNIDASQDTPEEIPEDPASPTQGGSTGITSCTGGMKLCDGGCVNTSSDRFNCGKCGNKCSDDQTCNKGQCSDSEQTQPSDCSTGYSKCGSECIDLSKDHDHCGSCNNACTADQNCAEGICTAKSTTTEQTCAEGTSKCGTDTCIDLQNSSEHCGDCDTACSSDQICKSGKCISENPENQNPDKPVCDVGQTVCENECVNLKSDPDNCGKCGSKCSADQTCTDGTCTTKTTTPTECGGEICDGECVDIATNDKHCGGCPYTCTSEMHCENYNCTCNDKNLTKCYPECVNIKTDTKNCGGCGKTCSDGETCENGSCKGSGSTSTPTSYKSHRVMVITGSTVTARASASDSAASVGTYGRYNVVQAVDESGSWTRVQSPGVDGWIPTQNTLDLCDSCGSRKAIDFAENYLGKCTRDLAAASAIPHLVNLTGWDDSYYNCGYDMNCANFASTSLVNSSLFPQNMLAVSDIKGYCNSSNPYGYREVPQTQAKAGDIYYWKDGSHSHTELVIGVYNNSEIILIGSNNYPSSQQHQCNSSCPYATSNSDYQRVSYDTRYVGEGWTVCSRQ